MKLRKLFLFTVVFGAGLVALWLGKEEPREVAPRPAPRVALTEPVEGQEAAPVSFRGRLEYTQFSSEELAGRRPKLFHFLAAHVEPLGGEEYDVENVFIELFEPESQALRATLRSPKSKMPIRFRDGRREFGAEDTVTLTAVDAEVFDGLPLVPARFEASALTVSLAEAVYSTEETVTLRSPVEGPGARASGAEFVLDQREGRLRFGKDGEISFSTAAQLATTLEATGDGALSIERALREGEERVAVLVEGGARLETGQGGGVVATAERIEFSGAQTAEGVFAPSSSGASGAVVVDGWGGRFSGERASFKFDEDGSLSETLLEGEPRARVPLVVEGGEAVQVEVEATESVRILAEAGFSVLGPSVVRVPDRGITLECDGQLLGTGGEREGFGWLSASGGVRATFGSHQFEGEDLELRSFVGLGGEAEWTVRARGAALVSGELSGAERAPYRAEIQRDLELRTSGEDLLIRRASNADLSVSGTGGFQLFAAELREASLAEGLFSASGGVRYFDGQLRAEATEASSTQSGVLSLRGGEAPVRLEFTSAGLLQGGGVLAREVRVSPGKLSASGEVRAELESGSGALEFEAGGLEASFLVDEAGAPRPGPVMISLREVERCRVRNPEESISWSAEATALSLQAVEPAEGEGQAPALNLELQGALASGGVLLERYIEEGSFAASGEHLEYLGEGEVRLVGAEGSFVRISGTTAEGDRFGRVIAREVRLSEDQVIAHGATIAFEGGPQSPLTIRAVSADWIKASAERVELKGGVHVQGESAQTGGWTLRSANAVLEGEGEVEAWGGFVWVGDDDMRATGDLMRATASELFLEGSPATLRFAGLEWEADEIRLDRERGMLSAGAGRVRSVDDDSLELSYEEIEPVEGQDAVILGLRRPRFVRGETEARAEWALLWVDQSQTELNDGPIEDAPSLFGRVDAEGFSSALDEIYIEGRVEVLEAGVRRAEVEAVYLDLVDGHGWLRDARLTVPVEVGGEQTELAVDAEWLRHAADGSLTANSARITTCDHVEPHYFIRTKDLRLVPSQEEGVTWDIAIRSNDLVFVGGVTIPLPPIEYEANKAGTPLIDRLVLGDTARFGAFLQATVDGELGVIESAAAAVTGADPEDIYGGLSYRASWLGERGLMLGVGGEIAADDEFWFELYADGLVDDSTDRGVLRVAPSERDDFRGWARARGRVFLGEGEWIDLAFSEQSDAGVQAEFFEREFLRYEERENYLHWRRAEDGDFTAARVKFRAGSFRNEVEELPSLIHSHGRAPLFDLDGRPVLYQASADFGRFIRREASGTSVSPFDPVFDTSLGTRDLLRFDTRHRLELPLRFAEGGVSAVPFMQMIGTSWSEGVVAIDSPHRGALSAGMELSATLWRQAEKGSVHTIAPFIAVSGDLWTEAGEGDPIPLDAIEDPLPGDHLDLGVHSRWSDPASGEAVDLSLFGRYARDTETVLPLEVLGEYLGEAGGVPFALQVDGRYDLEAGETLYSRSSVGFATREDLNWELGFHQGKDAMGEQLFEAASAASRWRVSPKWELEARQTFSLIDEDELASRLTLRRYGHDLIFDLEFSERLGEGGSSVSFSLSPVVGWSHDRLGLLDHWLTTRR